MYKDAEEVKQRIEWNYQAVKQLESMLDIQMDDEDKIELIALCGLLYSEFVTGVYSSSKLEDLLSKIARKIDFEPVDNPKSKEFLIVLTKAYEIGGHSVIANNWMMWDRKIKYSIVFTDSMIEYVPDFLKEAVQISGGDIYFLRGDYCKKAKQLLEISQRFSKIILLQHMFDIVPSIAYSHPKWKIPVILYNHANFKFSFGYGVSDAILNLLEYDVDKTICYRGVSREKSLLLPFPNAGKIVSGQQKEIDLENTKKVSAIQYEKDSHKKLVVSMGEGFKFRDVIDCSFSEFVKQLVSQRDDIQYIIIGPNPCEEEWAELEKETGGKAKAIGNLERGKASEIIRAADLYIVSFPMSAFGSNIAEEYGVPYLFLSVTGRGNENYGNNAVVTVEELLDKSQEVLNGEKEKYKGKYYEKVLNQNDWCTLWHKISDSIPTHTEQEIKPERHILTEEIVNCQLMQKEANFNVKAILSSYQLTPLIAAELIEICSKYDLHFIPDHLLIVDRDIYSKNTCILQYSAKWLQLHLKGVLIADYLKQLSIDTVAIYGMGQMGMNLYEELKDADIKVECFIDKNAKKLHAPIKIIDLGKRPERTFYIINTAYVGEEQLRQQYTSIIDEFKILSLFEIIDKIYEGTR